MNTYAEPEFTPLTPSSSPQAPTTAVLPSTATENPNQSSIARSEEVSLVVSVLDLQPVPGLVNTYAESTFPSLIS